MLDVGAGTGRVTLDLAAGGVSVVALDVDAALLEALEHRAAGLPVETIVADARELALGRRVSLVLVPMQTLQLLGGPRGRAAFLRRALAHLEPGGLLAAALGDAMDCFDEEHDRRRRPTPARSPVCATPASCSRSSTRAVARQSTAVARSSNPGGAPKPRCGGRAGPRVPGRGAAEARQLGFLTEPHLLRAADRAVPRIDGGGPPRATRIALPGDARNS